jgi:uncharacterized protein YycO
MRIAFYKARYGDWTDYLVALFTMGRYSHCEYMFSDGMWFGSSPRDGGVRYKQIKPAESHWVFLDLPVSGEEEVKLREWCDGEVGDEYDWKEVLRFVLPWLTKDKERWFCSEIVLAGLQQLGLFRKYHQEEVSPNFLYKILIDSGLKIVI